MSAASQAAKYLAGFGVGLVLGTAAFFYTENDAVVLENFQFGSMAVPGMTIVRRRLSEEQVGTNTCYSNIVIVL